MAYLESEEMGRLERDPFGSYTLPDIHIPKRFRDALDPPFASGSGSGLGTRDPVREIRRSGVFGQTTTYHHSTANSTSTFTTTTFRSTTDPGGGRTSHQAPSMGWMNEDEYTTFIREGMERLRRITEENHLGNRMRERERIAEERLRKEEAEDREWRSRNDKKRKREKVEPEPQSQNKYGPQAQPQPGQNWSTHTAGPSSSADDIEIIDLVRDSKSLERTRYINLWANLAGEIQQVEMRYQDIPWPIYGGKSLERDHIRIFLLDLATDTTSTSTSGKKENSGRDGITKEQEKKVLRDAIRIFHPDRFFGRFLDRVRKGDRDRVKQGVEVCSRVINALAAENAARR